MAYITARDLKAVVPDQYRDAALSDEGSAPDAGLLAAVIEAACNEVDALIEGRVNLPVSDPPKKLKTAALYVALEILFLRRGVDMPEAMAAKIKWWRTWLSKVGAGEMRLQASTDELPAQTTEGAIVAMPNVTGTAGLISALLFLFCLMTQPARAIDARTFSFAASNTNVIEGRDYAEWSQGESVQIVYSLSAPNTDDGRDVRLEVSDPTNLWINAEPSRSGSTWTFDLAPTQTCLPAGRYVGRVAVYTRTGTNLTFHRILAWQDIRVHPARDPSTLVFASPLASIAAGTPVYVEADVAGLAAAATVQSNLTAHEDRADNPHAVTAAQIGAATTEDVAEAVADYLPLAAGNSVVEGAGGATISFADEKITGMSLEGAATVDASFATFGRLQMNPNATNRWVRPDGGTNEMYFDAFNHQWFYSKGVKSFGIRSNGDVQVAQNLTVGTNMDVGNRIAVGDDGTVLTNGGLNFSGTDAPSISVADRPWIKPGVDGTNTMLYGGVKVESNLTVTSTATGSHQLDLNGLDYTAADDNDNDTLLIGGGTEGFNGRIGVWNGTKFNYLTVDGAGFVIPELNVEGNLITKGRQTPYALTYAPTTTLSSAGRWLQALSCSDSQPVVIRPSTGDTGYVEQITLYLKLGTNSCTLTGFTGDVPVMTTGTVNTVLLRSPYFSTNWYAELLE